MTSQPVPGMVVPPSRRAVASPPASLHREAARRIGSGILIAAAIAAASRVVLLLFFVLGAHLPETIHPDTHYRLPLLSGNLPLVLGSAERYGDFEWYSGIAEQGYAHERFAALDLNGTNVLRNWAFFPLQPLLIQLVKGDVARFITGQVLFFAGLICSFFWVEGVAGRRTAIATALLIAFFPFSLDISQFRPESAQFALGGAALLLAQRGSLIGSVLATALGGFSKPNAFLTVLPVWWSTPAYRSDPRGRSAITWGALLVAAGLCGIICMSAISYADAGDPLAWSKIQKAWGARLFTAPFSQFFHLVTGPMLIARAGWDFELFSWLTLALVITSVLALYRGGYKILALFVVLYAGLTFVNFGVWVLPKHLSSVTPFFFGLAIFAAGTWRETGLAFLFGLFFAAVAVMSGLGVLAVGV